MGNAEIYAPLGRRLIGESREWIDALATRLRAEGMDCETEAAWSADRHEVVAKAAVLDNVDLAVTEPSDRDHGLSHTEVERVLHETETDALIVKAPHFRASGSPHRETRHQ